MKFKKGISLIVLVITIIVMITLAASVAITLSNTGLIEKASQAVKLTDEKQVQDMAAMTWTECYIDEYRGTALVEEVTRRLAVQGVNTADWDITITDTGITVNDKNSGWDVVYEGSMSTVDSELIMPDGVTFDTNSIYRFTVESAEYTGIIETRLIGPQIEEGIEQYLLAVVKDGKVITFRNMLEVIAEQDKIEGECTTICVAKAEDEGNTIYGIVLLGTSCEYTVKKIDKKAITLSGTKIYTGTSVYDGVTGLYVVENISLDMTKKYIIEYNSTYYEVGFDLPAVGNLVAFSGEVYVLSNSSNNAIGIFSVVPIPGDVTIYEVGKNNNVKTEGANILVYRNSKWTLVDGDRIIPETVGGEKVDAVFMSVYDIYYDGKFELILQDDFSMLEFWLKIEVAPSVTSEKMLELFTTIAELPNSNIYGLTLDLSAFTDLTIPVEVRERATTIYVSSAVKAKYPDDDKITVK